jgi:hypothetical protein
VQIGVLAFRGPAFRGPAPVDQLTDALSPVGGQVDTPNNANDVLGAFVHAVSGAAADDRPASFPAAVCEDERCPS